MKVCVVGAGPGGMFFCHAMDRYGTDVQVTVYEQASGPGGVWRLSPGKSSNMYAGMWTNGALPNLEFFDYTFEDFQRDQKGPQQLPPYVPRAWVLEYLLARVSRGKQHDFWQAFQFDTSVQSISFDIEKKQFKVVTRHPSKEDPTTEFFDKCVWAGGENGRAWTPQALLAKFQDSPIELRHSTETRNFPTLVRDQTIVLIGGGLSAEDVALLAIKCNVKHVHIVSRGESEEFGHVEYWPHNKVTLHKDRSVLSVEGNTIHLQETCSIWPSGYEDEDEIEESIENVSVVIFCTGYAPGNMKVLDPSLQAGYPSSGSSANVAMPLEIPDDFELEPHPIDAYVTPKLSGESRYNGGTVHPAYYRGILLENPNFMIINTFDSYSPILGLEASAWYLAHYCCQNSPLDVEKCRQLNHQQALAELQNPYLRYWQNQGYFESWNEVDEVTQKDPDYKDAEKKTEDAYCEYLMENIAKAFEDCEYPGRIMIDGQEHPVLGKHGRKLLIHFDSISYYSRLAATPEDPGCTFRDDPVLYYSLFTGTPCVPLDQRWLDLNTNEQVQRLLGMPGEEKKEEEVW